MELADILVSYKLVEGPKDTRQFSLPSSTRYSRMLDYLESRDNTKKKEEEEPKTKESQGFVGWDYGTPRSSSETTSLVNPYSSNNLWMQDMTAAYKRLGLSDNAIKNLIAKNALESNWGKSALGNYNFGNLTAGKYWKGKIVQGKDKDKNGNPIELKFRAYDSLDDFVKDEIQFLTNLYDFDQNDDLNTFLNKLQGSNKGKRSYAEDPSYKNKVRERYMKI